MEPRFRDLIAAIEQQGRHDDAEKLKADILVELFFKHGLDERSILNMTVDEIEGWHQKPPRPLKYEGWDTFYWGGAIDDEVHNKRDS